MEPKGSIALPLVMVGNHQGPLTYPRDSRDSPGSIDLNLGTVGNHQGPRTYLYGL